MHFFKWDCNNNALSFATSAISLTNLDVRGVKYLEMHGSVYHLTPPVRDDNGEPIYAQIYIIDGEEAQVRRRQDVLHRNHGLNIGQLRMLQNIIQEYNPMAQTFQTLVNSEWCKPRS